MNRLCALIGHKYRPRYSYGQPSEFIVNGMFASDIVKLKKSSRSETYHFDICERCGAKVIK